MKVILLKDMAKVGQHGTIKDVADGYALNFLIARGLAVQATPEKIAAHTAMQKREGEAREKEAQATVATIKSLEGKRIEIKARATEKGGLFKSITAADIKKVIGKEIPEDSIQLTKPIKEIGEYVVKIAAAGAEATITLDVTAQL
ncbi:50S ribosomal protein L9 [Candidatus Kaiserbacteria bacterium RIFCSPHIGHO2_01_FULL_53_29]|uniref:Large ribosomal subunit protein bL9 n=1 Tax=Candidatus Kaiserbacteria bacterium RIFCSPHIGHO2_01_FULL_53_29 TaxID=1798480 RepID=A0A1F6CXR7_9BACT|nr:MAG: 50S ribosomal protein L9 [Candidatus Kaiserbacteria bacterium RIFCSPHIGHO2_01_FULL_53_29]